MSGLSLHLLLCMFGRFALPAQVIITRTRNLDPVWAARSTFRCCWLSYVSIVMHSDAVACAFLTRSRCVHRIVVQGSISFSLGGVKQKVGPAVLPTGITKHKDVKETVLSKSFPGPGPRNEPGNGS